MNEHGFVNALRRHLHPHVYWLKLQLSYTAGVPDIWLSGSHGDLWLETKCLRSTPAEVNLCDPRILSINQQLWLTERHAEGRRVAVAVLHKTKCLLLTGTQFLQPLSSTVFDENCMSIKQLSLLLRSTVGDLRLTPRDSVRPFAPTY